MHLFSPKTRYALHGLAFVASRPGDAPVPFEAILAYLRAYSGRLTLSPGYLAKVFREAARAGLLSASTGPRGGYRLARPAREIRLLEIVEALEGPLLEGCCLAIATCPLAGACEVRTVLGGAEQAFRDALGRRTLAALAAGMAFPSTKGAPRGRRRPGSRR